MGIAPFVAWYTVKAARTGDERAAKSARFWTKIFAVNSVRYELGAFSARTGNVIGQPLAMEGLYAFFLESIFLGVIFAA
jgi:cytochrome d ubiquinol oxidase subunit I